MQELTSNHNFAGIAAWLWLSQDSRTRDMAVSDSKGRAKNGPAFANTYVRGIFRFRQIFLSALLSKALSLL